MHPPTKNQAMLDVDNPTLDASDGVELPDGTENKDMARQEFKDESDINYMLSRFGVAPPRGAPTYGEWDDTIDLQTSIHAVEEAKYAYSKLPESLRNKFNSMEELLTAVQNGSLVIKDDEAKQADTPPPVQPA